MVRVDVARRRSVFAALTLGIPALVAGGAIGACVAVVELPGTVDGGPVLDGGPFDDPFDSVDAGGNEGEGESGDEGEGEIGSEGEGEGETSTLQPGTTRFSVPVGLSLRSVDVVVPAAVRGPPLPLLIALHGNGDSPTNFLQTTGLGSLEEDVIVAAPAGIVRDIQFAGTTIPGVSWDAYHELADNEDLQLLGVLVLQLVDTGDVDPRRIHVLGYSQGGFLAFRHAIDRADVVASAVVISAGDPLNDGARILRAVRDVPFRLRCGQQDPLLSVAQSTTNNLVAGGADAALTVVPGAGHVPLPIAAGETTAGVVADLVRFQLGNTLP
jgi:poly(3-hydroxybutyrate) depolymerase